MTTEVTADTMPTRPQDFGEQLRLAVYDLRAQMQRKRDLHREGIHRALIIALHTDSLWEKTNWG